MTYSTGVTSLAGLVTSGLGQGAYFMSLPWVRDAVQGLIGFAPYPGTLNLRLDSDTVRVWRQIQDGPAVVLAPPPTEACGARLFPALIGADVEAAVIVPDVTGYRDDTLELVAAVHLRSVLRLRDEDRVSLQIRCPGTPKTSAP
jgi:riboflavin kinase